MGGTGQARMQDSTPGGGARSTYHLASLVLQSHRLHDLLDPRADMSFHNAGKIAEHQGGRRRQQGACELHCPSLFANSRAHAVWPWFQGHCLPLMLVLPVPHGGGREGVGGGRGRCAAAILGRRKGPKQTHAGLCCCGGVGRVGGSRDELKDALCVLWWGGGGGE